ncbi:N-acetylglucosamine-6-phosphate deacetylase [uncultured Amnibacterium sp.]|uniref:N-acetylglucosamine-6-phosphate deacetylase n=1 Tax=uncultured Amnibacterium sp. TaxID=1631851 RepID=UPI0035CB603E
MTAGSLTLTNVQIVDVTTEKNAWIVFDNGVIVSRGVGAPPHSSGTLLDGRGGLLVPGFIDAHVHGGGGGSVDAGGVAATVRAHREHGTTRSVASLVSAPLPRLVESLSMLAPLVRADSGLLGVHLEGPFLSPAARGAHDPGALALPTAGAVDALLEAGEGTVVQVTVAPELPGAIDAIRRFVAGGVRVAVGHTTADAETARAAFGAGASILTHTYNAMPPLLHRAPGPVGVAIMDTGVTLELIADGLHVHPILVAGLFRLAPGRVALITDAMAAAGGADGDYRLGERAVVVRDGAARLADSTLAGSTLTMDRAVKGAVDAGVPLAEAVRAATRTPAAMLGRTDLGRLSPGGPADAVLLGDDLRLERAWAAGSLSTP